MTTRPTSLQNKPALHERIKDLVHYSEIKRLAFKVIAQQKQKMFRSLAVISYFPMEGKTIFCAAIAMAYAEICQSNVLVVDAATYHNPESLVLKDCLDPSFSQVHFLSAAEHRIKSNGVPLPLTVTRLGRQASFIEAEEVKEGCTSVSVATKSDYALISKVAKEGARQYGLVLMDTVSLMVQNKNNIDPLLAAHLADASVLLVSPKFLNSPKLNACLKVIEDPGLHLIGIVSNEEFFL